MQIQRKSDLKAIDKLEEREFIECWKDKIKSLVRRKLIEFNVIFILGR